MNVAPLILGITALLLIKGFLENTKLEAWLMGNKQNRPKWRKGFKEQTILNQSGKCSHCDKPLIKGDRIDLHHDYKGHGQAHIRDMIYSDEMKALGVTPEIAERMYASMYHHRPSVQAVHGHGGEPDCHTQADLAQLQGRIEQEKRKRE